MGSDLEEVFVPGVLGVGEGSRSGETRRRVVEAMEKTRSLLLTKSLEEHRPRQTERQDCLLMATCSPWPRHSSEQ